MFFADGNGYVKGFNCNSAGVLLSSFSNCVLLYNKALLYMEKEAAQITSLKITQI